MNEDCICASSVHKQDCPCYIWWQEDAFWKKFNNPDEHAYSNTEFPRIAEIVAEARSRALDEAIEVVKNTPLDTLIGFTEEWKRGYYISRGHVLEQLQAIKSPSSKHPNEQDAKDFINQYGDSMERLSGKEPIKDIVPNTCNHCGNDH